MSAERRPLLHVATGVKVSAPLYTSAVDRMVVVNEDGKVDDDGAISVLPSLHFSFSAKVCCEGCCSCLRLCSYFYFWLRDAVADQFYNLGQ